MSWPQEIRKARVYGNFKQPRRERLKKKTRAADKRPGMSAKHLSYVRQMPCAVCLRMPAGTCHHLKSETGERGMGLRSTDKWAVPLCFADHESVERVGSRNELRWFRDNGIEDPHGLALALWGSSGDLPKMVKILMAHRGT